MPMPRAVHPRPSTRYRAGVRDPQSRRVHAEQSREWRREQTAAALPPAAVSRLVASLTRRADMVWAAEQAGVTAAQVYGRMRHDTHLRDRIDTAMRAGCLARQYCGTVSGYRRHGGRCPDCRRAKRPDHDPSGRQQS
jgi:hypothetical protein